MSKNETSGVDAEENAEVAADAGAGEPGVNDDNQTGEDSEVAVLRLEKAELKNRLLLEMAEMENLRKRTRREKSDASRFAIANFARDLLTVSDDLRRAINAAPEDMPQSSGDAIATLLSGVEATERQLLQILERHGVKRFEPMGEKFNPAVHEALFEVPDPATPNGTICQVVEAGYMIGERVLRPARVGIAKGGPRIAPGGETPSEAPAGEGVSASAQAAGDSAEAGAEPVAPAAPEPAQPGSPESAPGVGGRVDRTA